MIKAKILITGVSGYIGYVVASYMVTKGYDVVGTYRKRTRNYGFPCKCVDLSKPFEIDGNFDVIIHSAGEQPVRENEHYRYAGQSIRSFKHNNADAMENVIDFARRHSVKKIIYLSSIGVYGRINALQLNEDGDCINPDAYGITKYMGELLLKECTASSTIQGISLRMPGVAGAGASGVWLTNIADKIRRNEDITIYTPDFQTKNFVYIDDLTAFICHLVEIEKWKYDTLVLACKESASVRNIVDRMIELTGSTSIIYTDDSMRQPFCLDASRAFEMGYDSLSPLEIVERYLCQ